MAILLALGSALTYGISDFLGGVSSRGWDSRLVTLGAQLIGTLAAVIAVLLYPGDGPSFRALAWGGAGGVASAVGVLALYHGFQHGSISVVAPVSGVLTTVIPALVGVVLLGNHLSALEVVGIVLTVPAVALVSQERSAEPGSGGVIDGLVAGAGFGLLFVALDRAGGQHGAWPLLASEVVSVAVVIPPAMAARSAAGRGGWRPGRRALGWTILVGILSATANLLYLMATHHGELAIVGVMSSLYPASTVLMALIWLGERANRLQAAGMAAAVVAVTLVALA